jgi:hypothetical protein
MTAIAVPASGAVSLLCVFMLPGARTAYGMTYVVVRFAALICLAVVLIRAFWRDTPEPEFRSIKKDENTVDA